jgi:arylsulfatase A-like enzyme
MSAMRTFVIALTFAVIIATTAADPHGQAQPSPPSRLNVVFILADDLGWGEVGVYGQQKIPTPNIDRLAAQGMRFTHHYSGAPVCAPSRAVLMTGRHLGHAEIRGNLQARTRLPEFDEGQYPLSARAVTIAQVFQRAGYATGAMGKWGLGPVGSTGDPGRKGFELFFGYNDQAVAHSYYPPHLWRNAEKVVINRRPVPGHQKQPEGEVTMDAWIGETYAPTLMVAEAERFIARHADRPFFLYLPFIEPHVAMHPPRAQVERFPEAWDDVPYRGGNNYLPHPRPRAAYAAMIADLDDHVGRVLAALERAGVADRTLVVFTSDNGPTHPGVQEPRFHIGGADPVFFDSTRGLRGYKGSVYEGGIRVPMIARLPGRIAAGTVNDTASYFADWFPTLTEAAGLGAVAGRDGLDGVSVWPVLTGRQAALARRPPMVWVFPEYGGQVAVRLGVFKVVRQGLRTPTPGPWEVYDLSTDTGETHDLAPARQDLVREAEAVLRREVSANEVFPLAIPDVAGR